MHAYLQNGYFTRVDGVKPVYSDVRLITLCPYDLKQLVDQGRFRADLYDRLSVSLVQIPPLRDRTDDIPPLAEYFVRKQAERDGRTPPAIPPETMKALLDYAWPRNAREMARVMAQAMVTCDGDTLTPDDVAPHLEG